jgi:ribosome-binding protein aMBF1 (putative translation factor)
LTCRAGRLAGACPCHRDRGSRQKAVAARALRHTAVMSEESARLARALVKFREAEGISERELARRTWLSHATIRTFERDRGDLPTPTVARRFEEVLGWAPGSIKVTPSEAMALEPSADSSSDLE